MSLEKSSDEARALQTMTRELDLRQRAIEASANAMVITGATGPQFLIEYVNPAFERITGYSAAEAVGQNCRFLQGTDLDQPGLDEIRTALREQRAGNAVLRNYRKDGSLFWNHLHVAPVHDEHGVVRHFVASQYDITVVKDLEATLRHLATHDELSGLANRSLLRDRLVHAMASAQRDGEEVWVAFVDLDRFKVINDSLGHAAGDKVLKTIAERLRSAVRASDTVARWGADEFVVLMPQPPSNGVGAGAAALQRIMNAVAAPVLLQEQQLILTCSIGVAVFPQDGRQPDALVDCADIAAHDAKGHGRNGFRFHTADMNLKAIRRLEIENDLRHAVERGEFLLHYQPQVDLGSGRVVGMEALIRWKHPVRGMVSPLDFIGIAEETGIILAIGDWVLREACAQNKRWQDAGLPRLRVAVNISARQFSNPGLPARIAAILAETGLAAADLEIEMTESMIMHDVDDAIAVLREIKQLGVHISVDDFGTGYSSLSYLKRFPIDVLKIDRSFVVEIAEEGGDGAVIVTSIIMLAHALRLRVIAEGVETIEQLQFLRRHGCDEMQGFYFSRPVEPEAFAALLHEGRQLQVLN
ncbi:hypothetical protein BH11PSE11_BH11PSE11_39380 [soil metagenome]